MSDFDRIPDESMRYEADFHLQDAVCLPTSAYEDPDRNTVDQQIIKQSERIELTPHAPDRSFPLKTAARRLNFAMMKRTFMSRPSVRIRLL